ncbi:MAG TPA: cytochrome c [Steroidobacteraceae bacterium]|jgi:hypothetical protein|nr:cytochrome c [Steroidobacteraceae bacterium]
MTANSFARIGARVLCAAGVLATNPAIPAGPDARAIPAAGLAISQLELMRASVQIPADGIWGAAGADKLSDDEWLLAEQDSTNLVAAASLLGMPGTGKKDRNWIASADWQGWVREFRRTALELHAAAKAHDLPKLSAAGDHLTKVCEDCHAKYRPATPSDGVSRYPFYPKRELPSQ